MALKECGTVGPPHSPGSSACFSLVSSRVEVEDAPHGGSDNQNGQVTGHHKEEMAESRCPYSSLGCPTTPPECG